MYPTPPSIEDISNIFQDFYARADSHVAVHISALAARINRDPSLHPPPNNTWTSSLGKPRNQQDAGSGRQMLTASEVTEKRKARKFLAHKQAALEEAVERRACESIYDKIWQHGNSLDYVKDERLRSKAAGLSLLGITMKDLGVDIDTTTLGEEKQKDANDGFAAAQKCLISMNDEKYPLGKVRHLVLAHKAIVETLTKLLPSTSSADEILPTLIYALITCPMANLNVISNLHFIQRFRSSEKMNGETAYCLTNLEAAVTFVENVDLPSLRGEETRDEPIKGHSNPSSEKLNLLSPSDKGNATTSVASTSASPEVVMPPAGSLKASTTFPGYRASSPLQQRRLGDLFQPPSKVLGAANDAVRSTADQSLKNIGATLDSSLNLVLGRLKNVQPPAKVQPPAEETRRPSISKSDTGTRYLSTSTPSSIDGQQEDQLRNAPVDRPPSQRRPSSTVEDRLAEIVGGRGATRNRSFDSYASQTGSQRSVSGPAGADIKPATDTAIPNQTPSPAPSSSAASTSFGSMRNFGNSFNPLNHIPGMIKSFGRGPAESTGATPSQPVSKGRAPPAPAPALTPEVAAVSAPTPATAPTPAPLSADNPPINTDAPIKIEPPIQRFIDTDDASELKVGDVSALLQDYKRLASALFKQNP